MQDEYECIRLSITLAVGSLNNWLHEGVCVGGELGHNEAVFWGSGGGIHKQNVEQVE